MSVFIENEYKNNIEIDYKKIIINVVNEAIDFVECPYECEINVTIVDDDSIQEINNSQRGIHCATDVLSFPFVDFEKPADFSRLEEQMDCFHPDSGELMLGDIVISYDRVIRQAEEYNHSEIREIAFLTAHSMLHLFGYDHMEDEERIDMENKQDIILNNLGITREI